MNKVLLVLAALLVPALLFAGSSTLTYTAGASTAIQNQIIPDYNGKHCAALGLSGSCTTAQLVSAGCVNKTFVYKTQTITLDSCTIFTSDAAGEQAFLQEVSNQKLVELFVSLKAQDASLSCAAFKAATQVNQDSACAAVGRPAGCLMCP